MPRSVPLPQCSLPLGAASSSHRIVGRCFFAFGLPKQVIGIINELEERERELARRRLILQQRSRERPELLQTSAELRRQFEDASRDLVADSFEFGSLLRSLVSDCHVYVVRSVDGGHFSPRANVKLCLGGIVRGIDRVPEVKEFLTRELTIDLFKLGSD